MTVVLHRHGRRFLINCRNHRGAGTTRSRQVTMPRDAASIMLSAQRDFPVWRGRYRRFSIRRSYDVHCRFKATDWHLAFLVLPLDLLQLYDNASVSGLVFRDRVAVGISVGFDRKRVGVTGGPQLFRGNPRAEQKMDDGGCASR